jgi:hypothetical protein
MGFSARDEGFVAYMVALESGTMSNLQVPDSGQHFNSV